ncbi:4Fe-4S dicluster domain-containing protein [Aeromicrobium phragmitis]|uniref:4Fe-4S dicluster domain-containing protein n=1 Tax=Aeromicrobium phragmitis TaxID=2478914 RepID=A0A3L8PI69_9ACTN|nr:heterodisulfide reductase-related iron-sulfur binding cluster [Aeromicrobium phragmitis]RLV54854.1 4Fe-4S dicluster domain-containing protein [Aeromicrobium phragmitis]
MSTVSIVAGVISLAVTAVAVYLAVVGVSRMLRVMKAGQPAVNRTDQPGKRMATMLKETVGHTRMLQWTWVGIMHWLVFAGFIYLSTAVLTGYFQVWDPHFMLPIIGTWYPFVWLTEALSWLTVLGIVYLIVYRQKHHPKRLARQSRFFGSTFWQAYFVELIILGEGLAGVIIRASEYRLLQAEGSTDANFAHFPLTGWIGETLFGGLSATGAENVIVVVALAKILMAMVWLGVLARNITMGVAWHRFTAWFNIYFKRESDGNVALGGLVPLYLNGEQLSMEKMEDLEEEDFEKLGVGKVEDFTWKGILDFTTCTECGRCQSQCPAWNTEKPLSPKLLVMGLREHAYAKIPLLEQDGDTLTEVQQRELERPLVGSEELFGVIDPDVLWSCTNCGACVQQCPVDIEHVDHIDNMRRYQVLVESNFPAELNNIFKGLERKGNPWGMNPKNRMDWAKDLDFEVKQVGTDVESLDEVDWLFWVGCAGAFEDRAKKTTQAVAELLNIAGVDFAVLGDGETCSGDPARRAGNEIVFMQLAMENAEVFKETKAKKVVSTCAHCFNTLKNEYAEFGVELEVVHHTQLLNRLVREGKLKPVPPAKGEAQNTITYHDPCFLGRHNQVYEPPRELLGAIPGSTYAEMPRNSETSFCCGAGGARMWMEETLGSRININRTEEAIATGADQIAVGCPFCRVMLSDGLTAKQAAGEARVEVEVLDVAQMLLASVKREPTAEESEAVVTEAEAATAAAATGGDEDKATEAEPDAEDRADDATLSDTEEMGAGAKATVTGESDEGDKADLNEPISHSREEDVEIAAESNIAVDDEGKGHGGRTETVEEAGEGEVVSADEVAEEKSENEGDADAETTAEPEPETKLDEEPAPQQTAPEFGDATDPQGEVINAEDDRPEIPATKDNDDAPAEELYEGDPHADHETAERNEELDAIEDDDKKS